MLKVLQAWSLSLLKFSWNKLRCDVRNDWYEVKKIVEIDMYLFIEKGLREGIPYIAKRYSKSNNKYMKNRNPKNP